MKAISLFILILQFLPLYANAQKTERPVLYGIAKMTFRISSFELAREYYGDFLGFKEVFSYASGDGNVLSFKVNDRQFLEFIEDPAAPQKERLVSVSFETEDVKQMEAYLLSRKVTIDKKTAADGAGNEVLLTRDDSNIAVEFICYTPQSLHVKSKGKFLSGRRIATRIHHVGLFSDKMEDRPAFYTDILGFERVLRVPQDLKEPAKILYFRIPGSAEMIENYPTNDRNFNHPCFVTMDIQETVSTLRERRKTETLASPSLGLGKRWLLNLTNKDGTRVEFTEPYISTF